MNFQVGDRVEHLTHNTAYGPGTVIKVGVEKIAGEINYYKDGRYTMSGPIAIKNPAELVKYTTIPNLGNLFTLECGTRILKGTDGRLLQLVNNSDI